MTLTTSVSPITVTLSKYVLQIATNFILICLHLEQLSLADVGVSAIQKYISYVNTFQPKSTEACQCKDRENLEVKS
jgi:hypothetical protein